MKKLFVVLAILFVSFASANIDTHRITTDGDPGVPKVIEVG